MEFKVWHKNKNEFMTVDEEWLGGVDNIENIKSLEFSPTDSSIHEILYVTYKDDTQLFYKNHFGSWGFPMNFE